MKWMKFTIQTTTQTADLVCAMLAEYGIEGVEIEDNVPLTPQEEAAMYTGIPAELPEDDGTALIHFYTDSDSRIFPMEDETQDAQAHMTFRTGSSLRDDRMASAGDDYLFPTMEALLSALQGGLAELAVYTDIGAGTIRVSSTEDTDWLNNWKTFFKTSAITENILVKPSWETADPTVTDGKIVIDIEPGAAFGTGTHETTKLIVTGLEKYLQDDMEILDVGCGSGIVSIAAVKLGARSSVALDIDSAAVTAAEENCARNGMDGQVVAVYEGNILEPATLPECLRTDTSKQFDIVAANILADVIVALCPHIAKYIKQGGFFLSSGILRTCADDVRRALRENRFTILEEITLGEWISFIAKVNP